MDDYHHFSGEILVDHRSSLGEVVLSAHCASTTVDGHRHKLGYASICLDGGYVENSPEKTIKFSSGTARLHPHNCQHGNQFGTRGAIVLSLQPSMGLLDIFGIDMSLREPAYEQADAAIAAISASEEGFADLTLLNMCIALANVFGSAGEAYDAGFDEGLCVGQLAWSNIQSPWQFTRTFQRMTGSSPSAYRQKRRLRRALEYYAGSNANWTDAAHVAGFADSAHLSRTCRRFLGCSPSTLKLR